ncbi:hypothetical protein I9W82_002577 [Candida metapsilosis]|uniref:DNA mismatch repair proteins mutS family domain-containing protein n=1 Tax=Candida metapsilosis TaxID=273372 RepID=A0A8H8DE49_9ASCO|nr:hypothetical protein I9W82_002577 [Candida metapsilosis]
MNILLYGTRIAGRTVCFRSFATTGIRLKVLEDWNRGGRTDKVSGEPVGTEGLTALYSSMKRLMDENSDCVCFIQVGSFYELYFDQAEKFGPIMGLRVTSKKTSSHSIPMAGFPVLQLPKYLEMLVYGNEQKVAIIKQNDRKDKTTQNLVHREVDRIVSPGTLLDESFLDYSASNYLAAISFPPGMTKSPADPDTKVGLAWLDVSVGETFVQQTTLGNLTSDLTRINPSEILIGEEYSESESLLATWYPPLQELGKYFKRYHDAQYTGLKLQFKESLRAVEKAFEGLEMREQSALHMALSYIKKNLPEADSPLGLPTRFVDASTLQMDSRTRESLELTERATFGRSSATGTLISTIRRTCTTSGARLLAQWVNSPLLDIAEIERRQSYVKTFLKDQHMRIGVQQRLSRLSDFVRIAQRLSTGRGDDMSNLKLVADALNDLQQLKEFLNDVCPEDDASYSEIISFADNLRIPVDVAKSITSAIIEVAATKSDGEDVASRDDAEDETINSSSDISNDPTEKYRLGDGQEQVPTLSIRKDYNKRLSELYGELEQWISKEDEYKNSLQETLLEYDPKASVVKKEKSGKYVDVLHISTKNTSIRKIAEVLQADIVKEQKKWCIYRPANWTSLQHEIADTKASIKAIEEEVIQKLKQQIIDELPVIRSLSKAVDFLDVTASFAVIADENNWVCPKVVETPKLEITKGRHVVVESSLKGSGEMFTPNDSKLGSGAKLWVISGPNMGGKSTYLRQNALMIILAQIGSYVPAERATIGVVDKIFTRIGASDDLFNDLSTFMVEMIETSNILLNATPKSFAIVDEVGRGTSGKEGLAIAYAVLVHLLTFSKCRTLFATHFGNELRDLLEKRKVDQKHLEFYKTKAFVEEGIPRLDHELVPGISERSYALEVARKAGFPESALKESAKVLELL